MAYNYVQTNTLYLAGSGVIIGATSINLTSLPDIYGNVLTMADFGTVGFGTLEPDTTNEEAFVFTGITANANGTYTLTGVQTVLAKSPYTATSGLIRSHAGGTKLVITDNAAFWSHFANKDNNETINGNWTFAVQPVALSATPASTTALGNVKAAYAPSKSLGNPTITIASPAVITLNNHGLIAADSVQFTTTGALPSGITAGTTYYVIAAGLTTNTFEISTAVGGAAVNTTGTQSGTHTLFRTTPFGVLDNDPRIFPNAYAVDTGAADAYVITLGTAPSAYQAGQVFAFKAANTNLTTTPTININSLGAKTFVRGDGSSCAANDIVAGAILQVIYDGTNFRIATSTVPATDYQVFTASGTWIKPSGLTGNELVVIHGWGAGGGGGPGGSGSVGGGGGGAGFQFGMFKASQLGSTETVTVATTAAAATGGGNSTFGSWLTAYGGGGGGGGSGATNGGGGGGGGAYAAGSNASGSTYGAGGGPGVAPVATGYGGFGGGSGGTSGGTSNQGGDGGFGGAGGTATNNYINPFAGANSIWGGGSGAPGMQSASSNSPLGGGTSKFGGAGGAQSKSAGNPGVAPGGGGGGGADGSAAGGTGARGEIRVWVIRS